MGAMNVNALFGLSAFDQTHDLCGILGEIAPNVSALQLFKDDNAGACTGREWSPLHFFPLFQFCFTSPHLGGSVLLPPAFTLSPFATCH